MSAGILGSLGTTQTQTSSNGFAELSSEDFVRIMVEELSNQDRFEPNDSAAILEQLSGLQNIESQKSLQDSLEALVNQNNFSSSTALIGKTVNGIAEDGSNVSGRVSSVSIEDGKTIFTLADGQQIAAERLQGLEDPGSIDPALVPTLLLDLVSINSASLIGRTVSGTDLDGNQFTGQVSSVKNEPTGLMLDVDLGGGSIKTVPVALVERYE